MLLIVNETEIKALKTLKKASKLAKSKTQILVKDGEYTNTNFGNGIDNGIVFNMKDIKNQSMSERRSKERRSRTAFVNA